MVSLMLKPHADPAPIKVGTVIRVVVECDPATGFGTSGLRQGSSGGELETISVTTSGGTSNGVFRALRPGNAVLIASPRTPPCHGGCAAVISPQWETRVTVLPT